MNLNESPNKEQLKDLIAECNDKRAGHILYVKSDGEVRIKSFSIKKDYPAWVSDNPDDILIRFEYYNKGQGYVGPQAAQNEIWVARIFEALIRHWEAKAPIYPVYIDYY